VSVPVLLDLFCGAGGAARGYQMAGFRVVGVDIKAQPRYAGDEFQQADALAFVAEHGREFDAIHASPPCQAYIKGLSAMNRRRPVDYPRLIEPTRRPRERRRPVGD
jgi:site-specific DNA-cytosine methylase